jgi:hypothetical protein
VQFVRRFQLDEIHTGCRRVRRKRKRLASNDPIESHAAIGFGRRPAWLRRVPSDKDLASRANLSLSDKAARWVCKRRRQGEFFAPVFHNILPLAFTETVQSGGLTEVA